MRKILIILLSLVLLSACAQSTALIGPAITIGNTGNVLQAGFSYGSNMAIKQTTGKTAGELATSYIKEKKEKKKIRKEIVSYLESHIKIMRKKLSVKK
tara:strand:- start:166 stop:459 length:294 start_codon:yes stop_codon:yes gene_type:complete